MTPEAERFCAKAHKLLDEADIMLGIRLYDAAGRAAYLAAFHATQALIFECSGKISKTHNGVHAEFQRITLSMQELHPDLRAFLSRAYNLKATADYETGPNGGVTAAGATEAVATAKVFVARLIGLLAGR